jgi:hydrogenase maturation protease
MSRTLVAGVGNIFLSDDGFGVEVVKELGQRTLPPGVELADFGIRGVHLAYQLMEGYDLLILVDAVPRDQPPGTLFVIEPDVAASTARLTGAIGEGSMPLVDAHGMEPGAMLSVLDQLGGNVKEVVVIGCQPANLADGIGLSPEVSAAVPAAANLVLATLEERHGAV